MNVDRWFAIKFPEAYQKSLKTHHTWFIVGAWWLLALIPDLPLWFVPNFSSYSFSPFSWFGPFFSFSFFLWFDQYVERGMKDHGCHCFVPIQNVSFFTSFSHIFLSSGSLDVVQDCHLFCDSQLNHYNDLGLPGAYSEDWIPREGGHNQRPKVGGIKICSGYSWLIFQGLDHKGDPQDGADHRVLLGLCDPCVYHVDPSRGDSSTWTWGKLQRPFCRRVLQQPRSTVSLSWDQQKP